MPDKEREPEPRPEPAPETATKSPTEPGEKEVIKEGGIPNKTPP